MIGASGRKEDWQSFKVRGLQTCLCSIKVFVHVEMTVGLAHIHVLSSELNSRLGLQACAAKLTLTMSALQP